MATVEWEVAHREVVSVGKARAQHEHALARALLRALRADCWKALGLGSFFEYAERFVGLTARQTEERLRVASAFEELPGLEGALAGGRLHFTAVRELTRVATPRTEVAWIEAAVGKTSREVEEMAAGHEAGDLPDDPPRAEARSHRVVLELSAETYAMFREAQAQLRRDQAESLSEDDMVLLMSRRVLGGPADAGTSSYQIQMTVCESCGRASQDGGGMEIPVDATVAEVARCDAQRLRVGARAAQEIPPAVRREVVRRHHGRCAVFGCRHATWTDVHHVVPRSEGGTHDPERLLVLCSVHHRAVHRGSLIVEGAYSTGFRFLHADGSRYGAPEDAPAAGRLCDVFQALRRSGFKESEARRIVERVRPRAGADIELSELLRMSAH